MPATLLHAMASSPAVNANSRPANALNGSLTGGGTRPLRTARMPCAAGTAGGRHHHRDPQVGADERGVLETWFGDANHGERDTVQADRAIEHAAIRSEV